eukprot:6597657-Prymnesium_polylepis.2
MSDDRTNLYEERLSRARRHNARGHKPFAATKLEPSARAQYLLLNTPSASSRALECAICLQPLCEQPAGAFSLGGRRTCRHLFHHGCACQLWASTKWDAITQPKPLPACCPLCRCAFDGVEPLPGVLDDDAHR